MKRIIILGVFLPNFLFSYCAVFSCDSTISYAIDRYSNKTLLRLSDYKRTIIASRKSEKLYTRVTKEQNKELVKLLERTILENLTIKAIVSEAKEIKGLK